VSEQDLREAVARQAGARTRGDDAVFASYMTPRSLLELRFVPASPRRFSILDVKFRDGEGWSDVRYSGSDGSYVVRQRWARSEDLWRTVEASCPREQARPSLWAHVRRAFRNRRAAVAQRA
jgi:hypothetical protein